MQFLAVCVNFAIMFFALILLAVGTFTKAWWVDQDKKHSAGLWERCLTKRSICYGWDDTWKIVQASMLLPSQKTLKNWKDENKRSMQRLDSVRAFTLSSLCSSLVTVLLLMVFIYFIRRKTQAKIAWWLKVLILIFNVIVVLTSLPAVILAREYKEILFPRDNVKIGGSWICVLIACILSFAVSILLVGVFFLKDKQQRQPQQSSGRKRKFTVTPPVHTQLSTMQHIKGNKSPPFVIPTSTVSTTPYHNHPYVQYFADETQPHYVDGHLEPTAEGYTSFSAENIKMTLANLSDYSSEQYTELSLDDVRHGATSSYSNLTHSYDVASISDTL